MTALIRRTLLVSSTAAIALALLPALGAMAPASLSSLIQHQAQARGGHDDGGSDDSDDGDDSGSDDSGSDHSGGGSGHDSNDDGSDDDGPDHDKGDDHGGDRADDDDSSDDLNDDSADDLDNDGSGRDRDEVRLIVNEAQLRGLLNGTMIPVDQNGKRLRFEAEEEHGQTEIKLRAAKGTLTGVTVIPAP